MREKGETQYMYERVNIERKIGRGREREREKKQEYITQRERET